MAENLFDAFEAATPRSWEQAAKEELQGANPWTKLGRNHEGLAIRPIYFPGNHSSESFQLSAATGSVRGPRTWYNCPRVTVNDPIKANAVALDHLQQGADGIFFALYDAVDFRLLLRDIEWPFCALSFEAHANREAHEAGLISILKEQKEPVFGVWYGGSGAPAIDHSSFRLAGCSLPPATKPPETAEAIVQAIRTSGIKQAGAIALKIEIGTDFFVETARLRAIRSAWNTAIDHLNGGTIPLVLHAVVNVWNPEGYQPHGNMLKATTAAMASILGGCDLLTVEPEDSSNAMMTRVARNVGNILREESHFNKVADPLAGAYFVDDLALEIREELWKHIKSSLS